jgi:hypothetical protein
MPTIQKIFAYNPGAPISGTTQVGNIAISEADVQYSINFGGLQWWGGPDESLGYVITYPVPAGDHQTPIPGVFSSIGFYGTKNMTNPLNESSFVELTNNSFNQNFTTGNDASTWLTTNGYWNSYSTSGASGDFNVTISQVGSDVVWNGSGSFNLAALTSAGPNTISGGYAANQAIWAIGPSTTVDTYSGTITYPFTFGGGGAGVTSNTGSTFGILPGGSGRLLYVPSGYVSNTVISGSSTYGGQTIAGMGLTPGTYTWSWGSGGNASTLVMTISS